MEVQLNGNWVECPQSSPSVSEIVSFFGVKMDFIAAAELNGDLVLPAQFSQTRVRHGDVIEVVQFVGGGF